MSHKSPLSPSEIVARCPTCLSVIEHRLEDARVYRCGACLEAHDLMASLA